VVQLLAKVTASFQSPFVSEELGERFANALNFCLDSLVGQKGLKLKVNDPEAYNFDPRSLLVNILSMYANMSDEADFLRYVVNDTRSYKTETFEKAVRILNNPKKGIIVDQERKDRFEAMVA
jgi:ubiquitin conjugation factor E4 B